MGDGVSVTPAGWVPPPNGWAQHKIYVQKELVRLDRDIREMSGKLSDIRDAVSKLQVKASVWGALAGVVTAAAAVLLTKL